MVLLLVPLLVIGAPDLVSCEPSGLAAAYSQHAETMAPAKITTQSMERLTTQPKLMWGTCSGCSVAKGAFVVGIYSSTPENYPPDPWRSVAAIASENVADASRFRAQFPCFRITCVLPAKWVIARGPSSFGAGTAFPELSSAISGPKNCGRFASFRQKHETFMHVR
jgi:hypothetical protein